MCCSLKQVWFIPKAGAVERTEPAANSYIQLNLLYIKSLLVVFSLHTYSKQLNKSFQEISLFTAGKAHRSWGWICLPQMSPPKAMRADFRRCLALLQQKLMLGRLLGVTILKCFLSTALYCDKTDSKYFHFSSFWLQHCYLSRM